jgi:molybdopterin synthase catalytic subunit
LSVQRTWITESPIDTAALLEIVADPDDGAAVLFLGTVRRQNEGRPVLGLRYEAYQGMAETELAVIVRAAQERTGVQHIVAVHRVGELQIGEISVAIAASSPHRADAFEAARVVIDEIKQRLPVWKHEHYADGAARWLEGAVPHSEGDAS